MKNISKQLRDFGFKTELSGLNDPSGKKTEKFYKNLRQYLGDFRFEEYLNLQDSQIGPDAEFKMMKFIAEDETLFKLLLSFQIGISEEIFKEIITIIKKLDLHPKRVLELGGANGWAVDYLDQYVFGSDQELVVVDSFSNWTPISKGINLVSSDYFSFQSDKRFDLIFSILGFSNEDFSDFLNKAISLLSDDGWLILGLRISSEKSFEKVLTSIYDSGCHLKLEFSERIRVGQEQFPILVIEKGRKKLSRNEKLLCLRKGFYNLDNPKKLIGYEASYFLELLSPQILLKEEKKEYENRYWLNLKHFEFDAITFRLFENSAGDLALEFPVNEVLDIEEFTEYLQYESNFFFHSV